MILVQVFPHTCWETPRGASLVALQEASAKDLGFLSSHLAVALYW